MIVFLLLLFESAAGKAIVTENIDPKFLVRVRYDDGKVGTFSEVIAESLGVSSTDVIITSTLDDDITFGVKDGESYLSKDEITSALSGLFVVVPTNVEPEDDKELKIWQKSWFVGLFAVLAGLAVFLLLISPLYWCVVQRRKNSETDKLQGQTMKRYDTISRDGSIQSRRKLAPSTLTLTAITQPSSESSDSEASPPGVKEALQSRTSPLTPLQLRQRLDNPALLYAEFSAMPTNEETRSFKKCSLKNRYKGVLPNLHSRVKLRTGPDDYINANYVRGYKGAPRVYIATQGPLKHTVNDFWAMVWAEQTTAIVMITKLQEKGRNKCVIYWPDKVGTYDELTVTVRDSTQYEGFTVTSMWITDGVETHRLCHMWMWGWPDQGVPESSRSLLALLSCVHSVWDAGSVPLIVHCSAGLGRTGCFIAVDIGIQSLKNDRVVDVLKIAASMRLDRGGMVQTLEQYEFIHRALLRNEMVIRNRYRFKGLRKSSFSHEGAAEALYARGGRRMSYSSSTSRLANYLDVASSSLPNYISPLLDSSEIPSPDSPKPPSLLQLSRLMEKSSKRKISQLKRVSAVDFSTDVTQYSPPTKFLAADDSSPEFLKTPTPLTKSSFSLDLSRAGEARRDLPRSVSEDPPDNPEIPTHSPHSNTSVPSTCIVPDTDTCFTFDFETLAPPDSPTFANALLRQSPAESPIPISS